MQENMLIFGHLYSDEKKISSSKKQGKVEVEIAG